MKKYILIAAGGFFGAILRYSIKNMDYLRLKEFPLNTLIINIMGSFLLALIFKTALQTKKLSEEVKLGITAGFLGAFTTFSTLCKETVQLISNGSYTFAAINIILSVVLGLFAAYLGAVYLWRKADQGRKRNNLYDGQRTEDIEDEVE